MSNKIAIVDDEDDIAELINLHIKKAGYETKVYATGGDFIAEYEAENFDLVVLDLMLPDLMGTDICKKVRSNPNTEDLAIIMLTAKADEIDKILGLELGADDYLTKPFSPRELVARVNAILRRTKKAQAAAPVEADEIRVGNGLRIIPNRYQVFVESEEIRLTKTEFKILHILASRVGWVYSREQLLEALWGDDKIVTGRTIDVHIKNLRGKLNAAGAMIENIVGVGYKLKA